MNERVTIDKPIEIKDNSAERVAFDLMSLIDSHENPAGLDDCLGKKKSNRLYYLNLYADCINAVKYQQIPASDACQG